MKNDDLASILTDLAENGAPSAQIDLWPAMKRSLKASNWQPNQGETIMKANARVPLLRRASIVAVLIIAAFVLLMSTAQGRAFAQRLFLFFQVTDDKSFAVPTDQLFAFPEEPTPAPTVVLSLAPVEEEAVPELTKPIDLSCSTPSAQAEYHCQIKAIETQAGYDIKEFLYDPKGLELSKISYNADSRQVTMEFEVISGGGYLYFHQGENDFAYPDDEWNKVPFDSVDQVSVNGHYAELVTGSYGVYPNATSAVWQPDGNIRLRLAWRDGNHWYVIEKMGDPVPIEWINQEALIKLAEGLVDERPPDFVPPLDPDYLKSVADAEELAGFDVLTPTFLPDGYEFKHAVWGGSTVRLLYGRKVSKRSSLDISMGPVKNAQLDPCAECPADTVEDVQVGPWQGWYWQGIYQVGSWIEGQPTPTPVWQADARHWVLIWQTDRWQFGISFWPSNNHEEISKEILIAIAESMK